MKLDLTDEERSLVLDQLECIKHSSHFSSSTRLYDFLSYITHAELDGEGSSLNQTRIALDVFDRDEKFDPSIDAIVRVEAGRLRGKLKDYFGDDGSSDTVLIELPKGRYNPSIEFRSSNESKREEALAQEVRFCRTSDGVSIAYAESGSGPLLVKAANWLSHLEFDVQSPVWRHWWRDLSERYRLIRYDERGCGLSDWDVEEFSLDAWTQDLEEVVDAAGLERFPLLGISQGASVAINYAIKHPEKVSHLVLYGGFLQGRLKRESVPEEREKAELLKDMARVGWGGENAAFRKTFATLFAPEASEKQFAAFDELQRVSTSARNAAHFIDAFNNLDVVELASQVRVKTLVIHARDEIEIPLSQAHLMAKLIPNAKLVTLESRNHIIGEAEPAWGRFLKEVSDFLKE